MAWYCKSRSYWYLIIIVVTLLLLKIVISNRVQSHPSFETPSYSVNRQERKYSGGWSNLNTPIVNTGGEKALQSANSDFSTSRIQPPTPKRMLFHGRPYTTPPTPNVVLPDFQAVAQAPTKPPIPFLLPYPSLIKTPMEIFSEQWVKILHKKLTSMPLQALKQVSVVFADSGYTESLLNWLIAAHVRLKPPLKNVLVICLDEAIFDLTSSKEIPAILVTKAMILKPEVHLKKPHKYVWLLRMVVYRMVNYFGYDVVSYDADAIPLRNLQPVFKKYKDRDIVGSAGSFPFSLGRAWGFTMCMGVILFRSTTNTELLWNLMSSQKTEQDLLADQTTLNYAFRQCGVQWQSMVHPASHIKTKSVSGQCSRLPYQNIKIIILPHHAICRSCLEKRKYYVVHPLSKKEGAVKVHKAEEIKTFFLAKNWSTVGGTLKGTNWLAAIMSNQTTRTPT